MPNVRSYTTLLEARRAADHLLANGIIARVSEGRDLLTYQRNEHFVIIPEASELDRAKALLVELEASPETLDPEWESTTEPDLSLLDPAIKVNCPNCRYSLRGLPQHSKCPECGTPFDLVEVLIAQHGPEVLADCYPEVGPEISQELIDTAAISCPGCGYSLQGLPESGTCPECGSEYSKREILRG